MTGVGFVGLGQIGRPMAQRLAQRCALTVFDIDPDACAELHRAGAAPAASVADLAARSEVVLVMVRDDEQVRAVVTGPDGVLAGAPQGTVVAVHSTVRPDTAVELADRCAQRGIALLDAPVSGGAGGAREGRLALLVGGDADAVERARPVLDLLGDLVVHLGPVGAGTRAKLARNLVHFVGFAAAAEAQRLAEAAGIDLAELGRIVRHTDAITGGPGAIMYRTTTAPPAADDPWLPVLRHVLDLGTKDLDLALALATELEVDLPLTRLARTRLGLGLGLPCQPDDLEQQ